MNIAPALSECFVEGCKHVLDLPTEVTLIAYLNVDCVKLLNEEIPDTFSFS